MERPICSTTLLMCFKLQGKCHFGHLHFDVGILQDVKPRMFCNDSGESGLYTVSEILCGLCCALTGKFAGGFVDRLVLKMVWCGSYCWFILEIP